MLVLYIPRSSSKVERRVWLVAEHLSVRLIIMQAWQALVGSLSEVVFVCLSVMDFRILYISCSMCPFFF